MGSFFLTQNNQGGPVFSSFPPFFVSVPFPASRPQRIVEGFSSLRPNPTRTKPMTGELRKGLRTLIVLNGQEFELPAGHTVRLYEGQGTHVVLGVPGGGASLFTVAEIQERGGAIVIRLGDEIGRVGNVVAGDVVPEVSGYPLPADRRLGRMVDLDAEGNQA